VLADLYSAAGRLPSPELDSEDDIPGDEVGTGRFFEALSEIKTVLEESYSWDVIDLEYHMLPRAEFDEPWKIVLDLANHLAETYHDVRDQIGKLAHLERLGDATWDVRNEFWSHTCNHVMGALKLLAAYLADDGGPRPPQGNTPQ